jgi:hypothetical protein
MPMQVRQPLGVLHVRVGDVATSIPPITEELAHVPPDQLLSACLEFRRLLHIITGILYTSQISLTVRAADLERRGAR